MHRLITGGIGHNLPQEAPRDFAQAVIDVGARLIPARVAAEEARYAVPPLAPVTYVAAGSLPAAPLPAGPSTAQPGAGAAAGIRRHRRLAEHRRDR